MFVKRFSVFSFFVFMVKRTTHKILLSHNTNPALYKCFGLFFCIVKHDAESGVNAVSPLYSVVIEHEVEIRGFYTASDVFFYGERYLCNVRIHARISQGDFLCFSYSTCPPPRFAAWLRL